MDDSRLVPSGRPRRFRLLPPPLLNRLRPVRPAATGCAACGRLWAAHGPREPFLDAPCERCGAASPIAATSSVSPRPPSCVASSIRRTTWKARCSSAAAAARKQLRAACRRSGRARRSGGRRMIDTRAKGARDGRQRPDGRFRAQLARAVRENRESQRRRREPPCSLDWNRFYDFIIDTHRHQLRISDQDVSTASFGYGVSIESAGALGAHYSRGRDLLQRFDKALS
jgi:hypothetical protein